MYQRVVTGDSYVFYFGIYLRRRFKIANSFSLLSSRETVGMIKLNAFLTNISLYSDKSAIIATYGIIGTLNLTRVTVCPGISLGRTSYNPYGHPLLGRVYRSEWNLPDVLVHWVPFSSVICSPRITSLKCIYTTTPQFVGHKSLSHKHYTPWSHGRKSRNPYYREKGDYFLGGPTCFSPIGPMD